jgi:hypothetical protein
MLDLVRTGFATDHGATACKGNSLRQDGDVSGKPARPVFNQYPFLLTRWINNLSFSRDNDKAIERLIAGAWIG